MRVYSVIETVGGVFNDINTFRDEQEAIDWIRACMRETIELHRQVMPDNFREACLLFNEVVDNHDIDYTIDFVESELQ